MFIFELCVLCALSEIIHNQTKDPFFKLAAIAFGVLTITAFVLWLINQVS